MKRERVPAEACLKIAGEIDRLVGETGRARFELLKEFWQAERGRAQKEKPYRAANSFKQTMFKARHGKPLGPVAQKDLADFRNFLARRKKAGPIEG